MRTAPLRIIGSYVSPHVRKVLAVPIAKGLPYEIETYGTAKPRRGMMPV